MKRFFTIFMLMVIPFISINAQYYYNTPAVTPGGNPGNLNTTYEKPYGYGLASSWVNIQPAFDTLWTDVQAIPFNFQLNGQAVTHYKVSTTGVVTFDTNAAVYPSMTNATLPNSGIPDKSICLWGLRYSGSWSNDKIVTNTFGTSNNRQHWIFFASYNSNASGNDCWTYWSIVLEETTNKIYMVDQRNSTKNNCDPNLCIGIQVNSSTAYMVSGSPNIGSQAGKNEEAYDNVYYEFIPGTRPNYDASVSYIQTNSFLGINSSPFEIRGIFKNYGAQTITSYNINYNIDGGPVKSEHVTGSSIAIYGEEWYFHDTMWAPPDTGAYELAVWVDNINGNSDDNTANDTMYKDMDVKPIFTPKFPLYEVFTSSSNPDCQQGNANMKYILDNHPNEFAMIKYQMDYPGNGDPYHTQECTDMANYYGIDSLPDMVVNGIEYLSPAYMSELLFAEHEAYPAYEMYLSATHHRTNQTFDVTTNIVPFVNYSDVSCKVVIVEKVTHNNATTNGETEFYYVMKKMLPNANGQQISQLYQQVPKPVYKSYTFDAGHTVENFSNLAIVAFVQDNNTKEILQATWSLDVSGIEDGDGLGNGLISLFPNPSSEHVFVKYLLIDKLNVQMDIYSTTGEHVYGHHAGQQPAAMYTWKMPTEKLGKGLFFLKLSIGERIYGRKFMLK